MAAPLQQDLGNTPPSAAGVVIIGAGYAGLPCALTLVDRFRRPAAAALRAERAGMVGHGYRLFLTKLKRCYETSVARAIPEGVAAYEPGTALTSTRGSWASDSSAAAPVRL